MITRIWRGKTSINKADNYSDFLKKIAIPDYQAITGNLGVQILRRDDGDITHFLTVTQWESEDAIRAFAGANLLQAKYYPEDKDFLLEFEPEVCHFDVVD